MKKTSPAWGRQHAFASGSQNPSSQTMANLALVHIKNEYRRRKQTNCSRKSMAISSRGSPIHNQNSYTESGSKTLETDLYPFGFKDTTWPSPQCLSEGHDTRILTCQEQVRTAEADACLSTSQQIPRPGSLHPKSAQTTDAPEYPD